MTTVQKCLNCGGTLDFEQMKGTNCPFCRTVLPHHGRAVEHAALVNNMLGQQMQASNPWLGGQPPQISSQYGAPPPNYAAQTQQAVQKTVSRVLLWTFVSVGVSIVLGIMVTVLVLLLV